MENIFLKPEKPFLLIYENNDEQISYAWLETEDELKAVIEEVKIDGCEIVDALEIGSCREVEIRI